MPERVLGAFQPGEWERRTPAGTEPENTLAESHFPGERHSAALSRLLWQQEGLRVPVLLRGALCFPTATREGGSGPPVGVGEASAGNCSVLPALE